MWVEKGRGMGRNEVIKPNCATLLIVAGLFSILIIYTRRLGVPPKKTKSYANKVGFSQFRENAYLHNYGL